MLVCVAYGVSDCACACSFDCLLIASIVSTEHKSAVRELSTFEHVFRAMDAHANDADVHGEACAVLQNLVCNSTFGDGMKGPGVVLQRRWGGGALWGGGSQSSHVSILIEEEGIAV